MVFAHGVGGAQDLPIPASYAIAGAGAALTVSFLVLILAWRPPRYDAGTSGRPVPAWMARLIDGPATAAMLRVLGLLFFGYLAWAAIFGPDLLINPTFGVVYVWLWVGIVPASLLLGPIYRMVSPARTLVTGLNRLLGERGDSGLVPLPRWVGYWPSRRGLVLFRLAGVGLPELHLPHPDPAVARRVLGSPPLRRHAVRDQVAVGG